FRVISWQNKQTTIKAIEDGFISAESITIENLSKQISSNSSWGFVPRFTPYLKKQVLQNIIWLVVWNHANYSIVKYSLSDSIFSRFCLFYLHIKSVLLGKIVGVGGLIYKYVWFAYLVNGLSYIFKGDLKKLNLVIKKNIKKLLKLDKEE
ncbi:MAG: hypothetical protein HQK93_07535, partial [Nitrospirae bacterium]|nr:hypothetical protein [Nitrospirota bacterium]